MRLKLKKFTWTRIQRENNRFKNNVKLHRAILITTQTIPIHTETHTNGGSSKNKRKSVHYSKPQYYQLKN